MKYSIYTLLLLMLAPFIQAQNIQPQLLGRDIISTGDLDFKAAFVPGNKRVYFSRAYNNWGTIVTLYSDNVRNQWTEPELVSFSSGVYRDADPFITHDGSKLFFISDRPGPNGVYKDFIYSIFSVDLDKKGNIISEPKKVDILNSENIIPLYPSVSRNGNLYFSAAKDRDSQLYVSEWRNGAYQAPRLLDFNSETLVDLDPVIAFDESFIIFTSNRKGFGKMDLWISFNNNGIWGEPINLGQTINSVEGEGQAALSFDQKKLYFTASREPKPIKAPDRKITFAQLKREVQAVDNGSGNIYEVDISELIKSLSSTQKP